MVPSYETMGDWLEEIAQQFPDAFFEELDGGIQLRSRLPDPEFPPGEMYIMGSTAMICWGGISYSTTVPLLLCSLTRMRRPGRTRSSPLCP